MWDTPNETELYHIAEGIEEFIWEYDTYHYMDENDWRRDKVIVKIKNQLKELTVFQQVYEVWHNEDLSSDERFDKLSKLLTV